MPPMDSTAKAALASAGFARADFFFLDVNGDPQRYTTYGKDVTFASTGDADLDGFTFTAFNGQALDVSEVANSESGSDTRTITLSGIISLDATFLSEIANVSLWQGRTCRTWFMIYDVNGVTQQGAIVPEYTGYMTSVELKDAPKSQTISVSIENYLVAFSQPSNRSYLNQKDYDSADTSAAATIAAANGARHAGGVANGGSGIGLGTSGAGGGRVVSA